MFLSEVDWSRSVPMMLLQQLDLSLAHGVSRRRFVVIVTKHVQDAMHDQQGELVVDRARVVRRLSLGDSRTQHHVTQKQRHVARIGRRTIGTTARWHSVQHDLGFDRVDRKRQHIRGPGCSHVFFVQLSHLAFGHKQQRQLSKTTNAFRAQYVGCECLPSFEIDDDIGLLIGAEYLWFPFATDSSRRVESRARRVRHRVVPQVAVAPR